MYLRTLLLAFATLGIGLLSATAQTRGEARPIPRLKTAPVIDGKLDEWKAVASSSLSVPPEKRSPSNLSATLYLAWDAQTLYLAAQVRDNVILNPNPPEKLDNADCLVLSLGPDPDKQGDRFGNSDCRVILAPTSAAGTPACRFQAPGGKAAVEVAAKDDPSGIRWAAAAGTGGYGLELAIPVAALGRAQLQVGDSIAHLVVVFDRDDPAKDEWNPWHVRVESSSSKAAPKLWPLLTLAETVALPPPPPPQNAGAKPAPGNKLAVSIPRHKPGNLFAAGTAVTFDLKLKSDQAGSGEATAVVTDYLGKTVLSRKLPFTLAAKAETALPLDLGKLPNGYYELAVTASQADAAGTAREGSGRATLGVIPFVERTAAQVRDGGYRIGLKYWAFRDWDSREAVDACCKLGLQWTRILLQDSSSLATPELLTSYPMNAALKVERFPSELFDTETYGPLADWEKANGRGVWTLKTLPRKNDYQAWLREKLKTIPAEQNVFEIWNEAWDKMSAEDLAKISQWIAEVILAERPNAIIGPNLLGAASTYSYDAAVIRAGGLKGMKMVALHPYAGSEDRAWLRAYRAWLKQQTGQDYAIYITEYGSHSTPAGPAKRSEREQAQRVVRQTLALYAEGVAAMMPHWMGQSEQNPVYLEDWFGFFRRNLEAKPVLLAHATSARMIDGKRYVGDLWYGPEVGAMLFSKDGVETLALWTRAGERQIVVEPGAAQVTLVNMVGTETTIAVKDGKLPLTVTEDVQYLVGVSPKLEALASSELRADRFPEPEKPPRNQRVAHRFAKPPTLDGKFDDWRGMTELAMLNPKVNGNDASGIAYLGWDADNLYVGLDMRDDQILNTKPRGKLYSEDSLELFVSTEPRDTNKGFGPHDHQFFLAPVSGEGGPIVGEVVDPAAGKVVDVAGAKFQLAAAGKGWVLEVALPWSSFRGFKPAKGSKLALELRVNDADKSHPRWKIDPTDGNVQPADPTAWSLLTLEN